MTGLTNLLDRIFVGFMYLAIVGIIIVLFFWIIPQDISRNEKAEEWAKQNNCEYIGSARNLNSVKFFECDGEVKMQRMK